ncbi:MAG: hypothetical protein MZV63_63555 [Marinilabiliales bacterium]|nr:hypothetical protein [Marinilabiliales bacterium]
MPVPSRIKNLKSSLKELRENYTAGKELVLQGKNDEAGEKFDRVFSISKSLFGVDGVIERECAGLMVNYYLEKARKLFDAENYSKAFFYVDKILKVRPDHAAAPIDEKGHSGEGSGSIQQGIYRTDPI